MYGIMLYLILNNYVSNCVLMPPKGAQYWFELILAAARTKHHISKISGNQSHTYHLCGHPDSLEHAIFFSVHSQIA